VALACFKASGGGVLIYVRDPKITTLQSAEAAGGGSPAAEGADRHRSSRMRLERWREIGLGAQILRDLRVSSIHLIATQHRQYVGLAGFGIEIGKTEIVES
jgi:3,4-dihydroxy 2-butanone 4-phosphate synthase/GTP cyclohydrolase II